MKPSQNTYKNNSLVAQLVEQRTVNPFVAGSSPAQGAKLKAINITKEK